MSSHFLRFGRSLAVRLLIGLVVLGAGNGLASAHTRRLAERTPIDRPAEPVIVSASDASRLRGAAPDAILAFAFEGEWRPIAVRIESDGAIVVSSVDAGERAPAWLATEPPGAVQGSGLEVTITDTSAPSAVGFVYLFQALVPAPQRAPAVAEVMDASPLAAAAAAWPSDTPGATGDTVGVYVPSTSAWFLRNANAPGNADATFTYGAGGVGLIPVVGDWDGNGTDTPGVYDPSTGAFFLRNSSSSGNAQLVFVFGVGGAIPIAGDWNGDGVDTIGIYAPATGTFFLRNSNSAGPADIAFAYGPVGQGIVPLAGDWDGNGATSVAVYVTSTGAFFLKNSNTPGPADLAFVYGSPGARPVAGDWNGDGVDTPGVYYAASGSWFLRNSSSPGPADVVFGYGSAGLVPLAGNWDGQ